MSLEEFVNEARLAKYPKLQTAFAALFYSWSALYGSMSYELSFGLTKKLYEYTNTVAEAQFKSVIYTIVSVGLFSFATWLTVPVIRRYFGRGTTVS